MLGKIIDLALNTPPEKRILLIFTGHDNNPAPRDALFLLNNIRQDITCVMTKCGCKACCDCETCCDCKTLFDRDEGDKLDRTRTLLSQQLSDNTNKIVLLNIGTGLAKNIDSLISRFDHVFVDDHQSPDELVMMEYCRSISLAHTNIISEGLLPVVKNRDTNQTSIWIFFDKAQSFAANHMHLMEDHHPYTTLRDEFIGYFVKSELTINLRNTYEISTVLSLIRKQHFTGNSVPSVYNLPRQERGHHLRGPKPTIYILQDHETVSWIKILYRELDNLKVNGSFLKNKDIAVLHSVNVDLVRQAEFIICYVLSKWNTAANDMITVNTTENCTSAEWPAVICICTFWTFDASQEGESQEEKTFGTTMSLLYRAISRARVSSTVILNNYKPKTCKYTDKLLKELKQRRDVCRIIEV